MNEYLTLGNMSLRDAGTPARYYIPHHPVWRADKLRVVFDASAKSASGKCLNDLLVVGPTFQPDLIQILLTFRIFPVALKADIIKMYRQVLMDPQDLGYQTILWTDAKGRARDFTL